MAIDFPDSPSSGAVVTIGFKEWTFQGGKWLATGSSGGGASALDDLTDVTITSVSNGQVLKWNGSAWVNAAIDLGTDTTGSYVTSLVAGTGVTLSNNSGEGATPTVAVDTTVIAPLASPTFTGTVSGVSKTMVGLGNVDNTSDANKPVSTAGQTALDLKANLASPTFTGTPTLPTGTIAVTQTVADNSTKVATTAFVRGEVTALVNSATATLDTLGEIATALGNDANLSATLTTSIGLKAPLASPTFTGTVTIPTGASITAPTGLVKGDVGLGNVDNTSDTNKPVSTAQQTALDLKANLASPTFTGTVTTNNLTVSGNLTIDDNIIVLNNDTTGAPSQDVGVEVERGSSANVQLRWNETNDKWQFTNDGTNYTDLGAGGATISSTAPTSPDAGAIWFDSDTAQTYVYYDSSWIEIGSAGGGARMFSSSSAPSSPLEGQLWFDSDTAQTFIYYDSQWIEIGASAMGATVSNTSPNGPISGQLWFNSLTGGTYVYYGTNWIEIGASPFSSLINNINAKGDLLVGTADNTIGGLAVGSANQVLTVDSSTATGLKWATPTTYATTGKAIAMAIVFGG